MKVWILQTGEPLHIDTNGLRPMRAMNLANKLVENGHEVVLWSSNFDHFSKSFRADNVQSFCVSHNLEIKLIQSTGYKSNIGFARLVDHIQMAINLLKQLKRQSLPDIAFIGYPPIETAWIMTRWCKKRNIPVLLDVKDAWPEIFIRGLPNIFKFLGKILSRPYTIMMKNTFRSVAGFCSPSELFLDWSLKNSNRGKNFFDIVVPLTTPKPIFSKAEMEEATNWLDLQGIDPNTGPIISFIGSINSAFDFNTIIKAAAGSNFQFVIAGNGPNFNEIKSRTLGLSNFFMPGWLTQCQALILAQQSLLMIAPLRNLADFKMNIPNKFFDYMSYGKPIVTSISGFPGDFVTKNQIGFQYSNDIEGSLDKLLLNLLGQPRLIEEFSSNSKAIFISQFSYDIVYQRLVEHLVSIKNTF
jgi:glycosyltransferase involved in cell wall biosynthesis